MYRSFTSTFVVLSVFSLLTSPLPAADWQPAMGPLMTRWAKDVTPDKVHPEYPRPQLVREKWTNLNGLWDYAVVPFKEPGNASEAAYRPKKWDGQILVPFPIESALSGVMKRVEPTDRLWYRRTFTAPELKDGRRLLLHFGAVDWKCQIAVNGNWVGEHTGGYDPFTFDITDALDKNKSEQELVVSVNDPADANWQPRGKQVVQPKGIWYTPTTGIWQTVWLEEVPAVYVESLTVTPDVDASTIRVTVNYRGAQSPRVTSVRIMDGNRQVAAEMRTGNSTFDIKINSPKLWSPDSPFLYGLEIESPGNDQQRDTVTSYFAMRKISLGKDDNGVLRMLLNNKPLFQWGPLDQGFWPDGLYTPPTDAAMRYDIEITKKLGFNMIRKHVKVEPARWYYYCDQLGMLVWQDMPSGDKNATWRPTGEHDGTELTRSKESADNFRHEWKAIIDDLKFFPSIVVWVPFNEAWGQFDTVDVTNWTMKYDPTRLVNCASGGNDFPVGHIYDIHRYPGPTMPALKSERAAVLGEFGGLGLPLEGHTWQGKNNWGYRSYETKQALNDAYEIAIRRLRPLIAEGMAAAVYTQTTDVEIEVNGFLTYDREVLKFDEQRVIDLHKKLFGPPLRETVVVPTSQKEAQTWRYTLDKPADGWQQPDFADSSWKEGPGGFGEPSTPGGKVRTNWKTPEIWLRRTVELPSGNLEGLALSVHHDEDAEVYLNGVQVFAGRGYLTEYMTVQLDEKGLAAAKPGKNVIAVHCKQTGGGQYIDVGLLKVEEASGK